MSACHDNTRLHRIGCGATYSGNRGHCVAHAGWSIHPDGICHETFASQSVSDRHWVRGMHTYPADVLTRDGRPVLTQDDRGVWHMAREGSNPWTGPRPDRRKGQR